MNEDKIDNKLKTILKLMKEVRDEVSNWIYQPHDEVIEIMCVKEDYVGLKSQTENILKQLGYDVVIHERTIKENKWTT